MSALLTSAKDKGMFFSLSKTTNADLYAQGVSNFATLIKLAPGTTLTSYITGASAFIKTS